MNLKNKKAYLATVEAIIGIVILLIVVFSVLPRKDLSEDKEVPFIVESSLDFILKEISLNDTIRECIITDPSCETSDLFTSLLISNIPPGHSHAAKICDTTNCVVSTPIDKDVFVDDILIASTSTEQNPKIIRLWMWSN